MTEPHRPTRPSPRAKRMKDAWDGLQDVHARALAQMGEDLERMTQEARARVLGNEETIHRKEKDAR